MHTYPVRDSGSYLLRVPGHSPSLQTKDPQLAGTISTAIQRWTNGHPLLTTIIRKYVDRYSAQIIKQEGAGIVDEVVRQKIIKNWSDNEAATYLNPICKLLLGSNNKDRLLITYMQVLSRGNLPYKEDSHTQAEQTLLLRSGVVDLQGRQLVVSNGVCASVFDMAWIEQQTPGLTRGVSVINLPSSSSDRDNSREGGRNGDDADKNKSNTSVAAKRYSKLAVAGLSVALCGAVISTHIRDGSFNRVAANTMPVSQPAETTSQSSQPVSTANLTLAADRKRFDQGTDHAANGRWAAMLQQFCYLPVSSAYFAPAAKQLERWMALYPKEIQLAKSQLPGNASAQCSILHSALDKK